jgi:ATP-binding cassette subfamily B multidrug efflux pump
MSKFSLFNQFFKGYGHIYLLGVCMLIAIDILFLWVPKLTGDAINTLYYGKEGLTHYIWLFVLVAVVVTVLNPGIYC